MTGGNEFDLSVAAERALEEMNAALRRIAEQQGREHSDLVPPVDGDGLVESARRMIAEMCGEQSGDGS